LFLPYFKRVETGCFFIPFSKQQKARTDLQSSEVVDVTDQSQLVVDSRDHAVPELQAWQKPPMIL